MGKVMEPVESQAPDREEKERLGNEPLQPYHKRGVSRRADRPAG